jgi:hypothetical protein
MAMRDEDLGSYLQDHYAGSVGAVELLDHLISAHAGDPFENFFRELRTDIAADQDELRALMRGLEVQKSGVRNAGAWMAEKFTQVKLGWAGEKQGGLGLLQALEALVLGITGKQLLWRVLAAARNDFAPFPPIDLARLEQRALEQRDRVEAKRLELVRQTFISE